MASIYALKPAFQALLLPVASGLVRFKITPNQVTAVTLLLSVVWGGLLALYPSSTLILLSLPFFLFLRMALNAIDGIMAKKYNMCSNLGVYLNELGDIISDTALYLPFALVAGFSPLLMVLIVILAILTEVAGIGAIQIGATRRYDGPCGKSDRAFIFSILALLIAVGAPVTSYLVIIQYVIILLLLLTIANRIRKALKEAV